jgi:flagellar protein FlgJ
MIGQIDVSPALVLDGTSLSDLRRAARQNDPESLKLAAKQFEALFMNMLLKSMREATPNDGVMDSEQTRMYASMLDQQLSQSLASRGVGLADVLIRQLSSLVDRKSPVTGEDLGGVVAPSPAPRKLDASHMSRVSDVQEFRTRLARHAEEASRATGIPAEFMIGQAALESGWGRREIVGVDGLNSHNLFGIKATSAWKGKVVESVTSEYVNGVPQKSVERFRAYDSYAEAFRDYANLLRNNPRYRQVIANAQDLKGFAQGLQRAGYATDPNYAEKLTQVVKRAMTS